MPVLRPDRDIEESRAEVHDAEVGGPMNLLGEVSQQGQRVSISHSLLIKRAKIRARAGPPLLYSQCVAH